VNKIRDCVHYCRRFIRFITGLDHLYGADVHARKLHLGNDNASWCVLPGMLTPESIVYSVGVGTDVSFDLELIRRFGVVVHGFDPTPRSIKWVRIQNLPERFIMHEWGVAGRDGMLGFCPPACEDHVSYSAVREGSETVQLPVFRLASIMSALGHRNIDVLKLDIEGSEYEVIDDLLANNILPRQLLVEFHHRIKKIGISKTRHSVRRLRTVGYSIFDVSRSGEEFGFFKADIRADLFGDHGSGLENVCQ
jgi:FkbM family methyltransferase